MAVGRANKFGAALAKRLSDVDADEVAYLTDVVAGTVTASKAVIVGANKNIDTISIADSGLKLGSGAGTAVTATAAELNLLDTATAGTAVASKALILGANKNVDTIAVADSGLKLGSGAGTAVTATAAELNLLDTAVAGTAVASKAAVLGENKELDEFHTAALYLGADAGTEVTATAAELNILDDATVTTAELNLLDDIVASFSFSASAGASDVCEVAITLKDAAGATVDGARPFMVWLSDAATGVGLTGTSASGTVQAKAESGADFATFTAKKALLVQPLATGIYTLEITDTAKTAFYVCAATLDGRAYSVSTVLATEDYGAGE
jgi:hypothetical protein